MTGARADGSAGPRVIVAPTAPGWAAHAVERGGARVVGTGDGAQGVVWVTWGPDGLLELLADNPGVGWVQLPMAGVERLFEAGLFSDPRGRAVTWTCAKGSYARPVAEHALAMALAGLRHFVVRARARQWGRQMGTTLYDAPVTILGAGGITTELMALLEPFGCQVTVVRRGNQPMAGAWRTVPQPELHSALPSALVVFLALSLSPSTMNIISAPELALMRGGACLVNVARGRHVDTAALVDALTAGQIGGACLDVTDPEPLPAGHPLWSLDNCLITPHSADTDEMVEPLLAARIEENVRRLGAGQPLIGTVDVVAGY